MNNTARIVKIHAIEKHPNADNLQIVRLFGTQVITDLSTKQDDLMIYFDSNLKLSSEYLKVNNLYRTPELNEDTTKKGYFDDNGRVKAIKLRGEFSDGVLMPLTSLHYIPYFDHIYHEGQEFNDISSHRICEKYIPPVDNTGLPSSERNKTSKSKISAMFLEHYDTSQYMKDKVKIAPDQVVYISEKLHGTSNRTGNVIVTKQYPRLLVFIAKLFGFSLNVYSEYKVLNGTRRTTITKLGSEGFHDNSIRDDLYTQVKDLLYKGEELYVEIVGFEKSGRWIQKDFPYGSEPCKCRYFLYRVSHNNEDGVSVDLSPIAVSARAKELGLEYVPILATYHYTGTRYSKKILDSMVVELAQGQSTLDLNTMREGVVVWFMDKYGKWTCLKYKQDAFKLKTSKQADEGINDIEDTL